MNKFIDEAYKEAQKAYNKLEVPVGAVIVKDGKIIARAHNLREKKNNALAHAEILCINKACKKLKSWRLENTHMYVTLEPCAMCAGALSQSRIEKVFFCAKDQKNGCIGSVCNILNENTTHKVKFEYVEDEKCSEIISEFFKMIRKSKKES